MSIPEPSLDKPRQLWGGLRQVRQASCRCTLCDRRISGGQDCAA
jgi:hypothetical protein